MLIQFKVSNYRSIGEEQVISLLPAPKQKDFENNILEKSKYQALNAIAIYGPNGSGKSNLLQAMDLLDSLVHISARTSSITPLPYDPFLLKQGLATMPTLFEITFILNGYRYRYGLEFNKEEIIYEWLFRKGQSREVSLFQRKNDIIDVSPGFQGSSKAIDAAIEATRKNALFLSTCDMLNVEEAKQIFQWFNHFRKVDGIQTEDEVFQTFELWQNPEYRLKIKEYFSRLNLSIVDLEITTQKFDSNELNKQIPDNLRNAIIKDLNGKEGFSVWSTHKMYDANGSKTKETVNWKLEERESAGTKKAFHISGPIIWALVNGGTLIIDEIEAKMHSIMTLQTINLFLNKKTNPNKAQLIFATHDTNLLSYCDLRRDQIYFSSKNKWESTEVYSLSDFVYIDNKKSLKPEKERPDTDKEKRYFEGRYGAVPDLKDLLSLEIGTNG
ncbi:ATP/GTP-binding protein [Spirosoma sp. 48-14]|uniref:AAA family ATPase n=1 Tax=Spirosoma sp. 48-14 TaxID=1895854 RepID=UPI00095AD940|nr:ATP-binding protein [Spirosoma sp. 48-14]OJW70283.1 MAG: RloA [Spirosoma sp. 48-14]